MDNTKILHSQDVETLTKLLKQSWNKLSANELAQLQVPVSLFNTLVTTWEKFLSHVDDIKFAIDINQAHFSNISFKAFTAALFSNASIEFLYLRNINDTEARILSEALTKNTTITQLNLANNDISDAGAVAIAEALKYNKTITWLDMSNNDIGNIGAQAMASASKNNEKLTYINLKNNPINTKGENALASAALASLTKCTIWITKNNTDLRVPFIYSLQ
jgi:Leucine-rich repeat (LRR) protein